MRYELNGSTYYTETKRVTKTWIREQRENGQVMTCIFAGLPFDATEKEIHEYMLSHGAKVISGKDTDVSTRPICFGDFSKTCPEELIGRCQFEEECLDAMEVSERFWENS